MFRRTILASLTTATLLLTAACGTDTTAGAADTTDPSVPATASAAITQGPSPSAPAADAPVSSMTPTAAAISDVTDVTDVTSPSAREPSSSAGPSSSATESSSPEPVSSATEPSATESSSGPVSSVTPTAAPSSVATPAGTAGLPVLVCGDGSVLAQFIQLTPEQAVARKAELAETFRGATIAQVDPACATPDQDPIVIAWWSVDGTTGNDTEDLFRLRRAQGNGRAVVLAMFPHGAYYYSSGLCSLTADGDAPRIGPDTPITAANKPWLFEMTSILAANGYIHPDNSGVTTMSSEVVAGVKAFQKAKGLTADGWIGPDTFAKAGATVCSSGEPVSTTL